MREKYEEDIEHGTRRLETLFSSIDFLPERKEKSK